MDYIIINLELFSPALKGGISIALLEEG